MIRVIYVAGPFRPKPLTDFWALTQNIRCAEALGLEVARLGAMPLIPHTNTASFQGISGIDDQVWIDGTLELLKRCDAAIFVPGWEASAGSRGERQWCLEHHRPTFDTLEQLRGWLEATR